MSETYRATAETLNATLGLVQADTTSPISQLIPYITRGFSVAVYLLKFLGSLFQPLLLLSPLPILLYVFAPLTVFIDITTTIFIRSPYRIAAYFVDALYPLYVLCGVACIIGGLLGLTGRVLCRVMINSIQVKKGPSISRITAGHARVKTEHEGLGMKGKGRKVDRVKFES